MSGPVRVRTYSGGSADEAARKFEADAAEAARHDWLPESQVWEGSTLTVVYQRRGAPEPGAGGPAEVVGAGSAAPEVVAGGSAAPEVARAPTQPGVTTIDFGGAPVGEADQRPTVVTLAPWTIEIDGDPVTPEVHTRTIVVRSGGSGVRLGLGLGLGCLLAVIGIIVAIVVMLSVAVS